MLGIEKSRGNQEKSRGVSENRENERRFEQDFREFGIFPKIFLRETTPNLHKIALGTAPATWLRRTRQPFFHKHNYLTLQKFIDEYSPSAP